MVPASSSTEGPPQAERAAARRSARGKLDGVDVKRMMKG